jgi:hypothetical protein
MSTVSSSEQVPGTAPSSPAVARTESLLGAAMGGVRSLFSGSLSSPSASRRGVPQNASPSARFNLRSAHRTSGYSLDVDGDDAVSQTPSQPALLDEFNYPDERAMNRRRREGCASRQSQSVDPMMMSPRRSLSASYADTFNRLDDPFLDAGVNPRLFEEITDSSLTEEQQSAIKQAEASLSPEEARRLADREAAIQNQGTKTTRKHRDQDNQENHDDTDLGDDESDASTEVPMVKKKKSLGKSVVDRDQERTDRAQSVQKETVNAFLGGYTDSSSGSVLGRHSAKNAKAAMAKGQPADLIPKETFLVLDARFRSRPISHIVLI